MAKCIVRWLEDQKVWDSISMAGHVQEYQVNFALHTVSIKSAVIAN